MNCPNCGIELSHLINYQSGTIGWAFSLKDDGETRYEEFGFDADDEMNDYICPECYEVLANNEEEAKKLLENG